MTQRINWLKIAKTAVGAAIAAAIAYGLGLNYAVSAGIICLLTVCDTRKETVMVTLKRLMAFAAVTLLCTLPCSRWQGSVSLLWEWFWRYFSHSAAGLI